MERSLKKKRPASTNSVLTELLRLSEKGGDGTEQDRHSELTPNSQFEEFKPVFPDDDSNESEPEYHEPTLKELTARLRHSGPTLPLSDCLDAQKEYSEFRSGGRIGDEINVVPPEASPSDPSPQESALNDEADHPVYASDSNMIAVHGLHKGYIKAKKMIPVLQGIDLNVAKGEYLSIVGQSGSGKSTLLHLMGTLDVPDKGTIHFDGQRIDNLPATRRDFLRNRYIGMIFQFYHLIPEMTTLENVLAPLMIRDSLFRYIKNRRDYRRKAEFLLDLVGLSHRLKHRPGELSGGEMQRASIARALIGDPGILLADEPTGNLDSKTSQEIIKLLRGLNQKQNLTIVMVTHDLPQARDADRIIRLVDGRIVPD